MGRGVHPPAQPPSPPSPRRPSGCERPRVVRPARLGARSRLRHHGVGVRAELLPRPAAVWSAGSTSSPISPKAVSPGVGGRLRTCVPVARGQLTGVTASAARQPTTSRQHSRRCARRAFPTAHLWHATSRREPCGRGDGGAPLASQSPWHAFPTSSGAASVLPVAAALVGGARRGSGTPEKPKLVGTGPDSRLAPEANEERFVFRAESPLALVHASGVAELTLPHALRSSSGPRGEWPQAYGRLDCARHRP